MSNLLIAETYSERQKRQRHLKQVAFIVENELYSKLAMINDSRNGGPDDMSKTLNEAVAFYVEMHGF